MNIADEKKSLRKQFLKLRESMSSAERLRCSKAVCERLLSLEEVKNAQLFGAYVSDGFEVDLSFFIEQALEAGKGIALPRFAPEKPDLYEMVGIGSLKDSLTIGKWNIPEPKSELAALSQEKISQMLWLAPAVAFDRTGMRLGRGKGIYDRLLRQARKVCVGAAYECQISEKALPCDEFDRKLDIIVSEANVYRF